MVVILQFLKVTIISYESFMKLKWTAPKRRGLWITKFDSTTTKIYTNYHKYKFRYPSNQHGFMIIYCVPYTKYHSHRLYSANADNKLGA